MDSRDTVGQIFHEAYSMKVEIDKNSGFCGGVIRAIKKAESFLAEHPGENLYSLGAIVHNDAELARLHKLGLTTIDYDDLCQTSDASGHTLLIRAHGEPPVTYMKAEALGFNVVDCTCPVVLDLQKSIREAYATYCESGVFGQILIFGLIGHAETLGLMGQIPNAIVIENLTMLQDAIQKGTIDLSSPIDIFSQTTKSPSEYAEVCSYLKERAEKLEVHNTICTQVATRQAKLTEFASKHDVIVFVSGKASSNGKILCGLCRNTNIRTYHIESSDELRPQWFRSDDNVGVCGATSTPRWLLEEVEGKILEIGENFPNFASE